MLLLKILGSIVVIGASTLLGLTVSNDYAKRPGQLRDIQAMLQILENEIAFMSNLLKDALLKAGYSCKSSTSCIFTRAAESLESGCTSSAEAWKSAVMECSANTSLNEEDKEILISFGNMLGNSDYEGQIRNIKLLMAQLNIQEKKAEELRKKNEALYRNLGILGGLAVVIILF